MNDMLAQQYGLSATGENAAQIASMLGKVLEGQTGALSRYGYKFDEAQERILKYGTEMEHVAVLCDVVKNLRSSTGSSGKRLNDATGLSKGVRRLVYKEKLGFRVTIGTKGGKKASGYHRSRNYRRVESRGVSADRLRSMEKPVLLWVEGGTKRRHTKTATKVFRCMKQEPTPAKPQRGYDSCLMAVVCLGKDYSTAVELAEQARQALEEGEYSVDGLELSSCLLTDREEFYEADAYVERLIFTVCV